VTVPCQGAEVFYARTRVIYDVKSIKDNQRNVRSIGARTIEISADERENTTKNRMEKSLTSPDEYGELEIDPLGVYEQLNKIIVLILSLLKIVHVGNCVSNVVTVILYANLFYKMSLKCR